jgi:signal transduction histidine kinase/HAMP domain-containing protein
MEADNSRPIPFRHRLTVRLTGGVIVVLLLIGCPFLLAFHRLQRRQQLDALTEAADGLSNVILNSLRSAMLAGRPHLLDEPIRGLSDQAEVRRAMLLDHEGRVRVTTDRAYEGRVLDREREISCGVCHRPGRSPPSSRTAVTREQGRHVFRTMTTIPNEPRCHACHDPGDSTNGILLIDLALSSADRRFFASIGSTLALGTAMVLLTVAVLVLLLRRMVHNPLRAVVTTGQRIVRGDLDARAPVAPSGEFAQLASQVNRLTDHLAGSIRTVETQRRELQTILDAIDDEIVVLDRERRVVAANEVFRKRSGQSGPDITGRLCHEVSAAHWPCTADQPGGCPVKRVFNTGRLSKGIITGSGPDGEERIIEIHASPLLGPDGRVSQAVEVRRDISERRQMEAILAHSEQLASLGLLASGLSHEINNPLGAIATSVAGIRRRLPSEPGISTEAAKMLETILGRIGQEIQRGRAITHRLLRIARPPGSTRSLVDVNHVVEEIVAILSHDIRRSGISAQLALGDDLTPLRGDEFHLNQIIMNLILNAIQAMAADGGELRISTRAVGGMLLIEVEDSGCGIPSQFLKKIYEPFFTTKPAGKGTGLGLFITHRLVSDMGGSIDVRSEPERGTIFTIRLPLARAGDEQ